MDPKHPQYPPQPPPLPPNASSAAQPPVPPKRLPPSLPRGAGTQQSPDSLIVGGASLGRVFPYQGEPGIAPIDGRTVALRWLGSYLTSRLYARPGAWGEEPMPFRVPLANFFVEPPGPEEDLPFPSIAVIGVNAEEEPIGLTPTPDEQTTNVYGVGTVAVPMYSRDERVRLQVWSSELPELRGIVEGITQAFAPTEGRTGIVVRMPDYYGQTVRFTLLATDWPLEAAAVRNRRWAFVEVRMEYDVTRLVRFARISPQVQTNVELVGASDPLVQVQMPARGNTGRA